MKKIIIILLLSIFIIAPSISSNYFSDVKQSDWYSEDVSQLYSKSIIKGYSDDTFKPNNYVTRAELSTVIMNTIDYIDNETGKRLSEIKTTDEKVLKVISSSIPAIVRIESHEDNSSYYTYGTGVIMEGNNIVTANHVIEDSDEIKVILSSNHEYVGKVEYTDEHNDLALISIEEETKLPYLELANNTTKGQTSLAIGFPLNSKYSVTKGIVSNIEKGRIRTDTAINGGNSGGVLLDLEGKVLGIVVSKIANDQVDNVAFAVESETVRAFLNGQITIHMSK